MNSTTLMSISYDYLPATFVDQHSSLLLPVNTTFETLSVSSSLSSSLYTSSKPSATASSSSSSLDVMHNELPYPIRDSLYIVIPLTIVYSIIFLTGVLGNIITCIVISRNKSMHTATNYYLFSLAVSDLLLLFSGEFFFIKFLFIFG